jgi:hypothetical protein
VFFYKSHHKNAQGIYIDYATFGDATQRHK